MIKILAIYGSPRRKGNTSELLKRSAQGATESGAQIEEIFLRDLKISPCLELYGCKKTGRCVINDDFQNVYDKILSSHGVILASPIFFYMVSAHTKILMDRCQSLWVKKYWLKNMPIENKSNTKKALFISVGATRGKRLFDGVLLGVRYFFDAIDVELWKSILYRGLDLEGDVLNHPDYLEEAYNSGKELVNIVQDSLR